MKIHNPFGYLLNAVLLIMLLSACGPLEQRLADGTAVAAGKNAFGLFSGDADLPQGEGVGGGAGIEGEMSPEEIATALAQTLNASNLLSSPTSTLSPESGLQGVTTPTPTPTPTEEAAASPTVPGYQLTGLAQTLTSMAGTPGAGDQTGTLAPDGSSGGGEATPEDTATPIPVVVNPCNSFRFVAHITYPIGSIVEPETYFYKSWRVQNTGDCVWNSNYALVYYDGFQLGGLTPSVFGGNTLVYPGEYLNLQIQLYTPPQGGTYTSYWLLRDDQGNLFGGGEDGNEYLVVQVFVPGDSGPVFEGPIATDPGFTPAP